MVQRWFFALGVLNNLLLIVIFLLRRHHLGMIQSYGWLYLLLAIPAVYTLVLAQGEKNSAQLSTFLGIFLAFLVVEGLFEFVLKLPFREDWRLLGPYVVLYLSMNYGFVVMSWKHSRSNGAVMLALLVVQLVTNMLSHRG